MYIITYYRQVIENKPQKWQKCNIITDNVDAKRKELSKITGTKIDLTYEHNPDNKIN